MEAQRIDPSLGTGALEGATRIYGNSRAAWFRDGHYYDRGGAEISSAQAAEPEFEVAAEPEPIVEDSVPSYGPAPAAGTEPVVVSDDRETKLTGMHPKKLAALVRLAGGEPATGHGAAALNRRWLLDHTE